MPLNTSPRSVRDATRFTAATPHASSKLADSRFGQPSAAAAAAASPAPSRGPRITPETPEERVARLRAAHQRAAAARVSRLDRIIGGGRRFLDSAHRVTIWTMVGFTVIAAMATVYTAADMIVYNRKRRAEFIEAQRKLEADSLEAARLAYMTGKATEEQIALVEEAIERENRGSGSGSGSLFSKLPSPLSAPKPRTDDPLGSADVQRAAAAADATKRSRGGVVEAAKWPASATVERGLAPGQEEEVEAAPGDEKKKTGLWTWMTSSLKKEEEGDDAMSSQRRLGYESLSEEDDGAGVRDSDLIRAVEEKEAYIRQKAREAFEREKENQKTGGPLDRVGLDAEKEKSKKGWWWW